MKATLENLLYAQPALLALNQKELKPGLAFVVAGLMEEIAPIVQRGRDAVLALMKKYDATEQSENGVSYWQVDPQHPRLAEYEAERAALMGEVVELRTRQIKLSELEACPGVSLRPAEVSVLRWLVVENE